MVRAKPTGALWSALACASDDVLTCILMACDLSSLRRLRAVNLRFCRLARLAVRDASWRLDAECARALAEAMWHEGSYVEISPSDEDLFSPNVYGDDLGRVHSVGLSGALVAAGGAKRRGRDADRGSGIVRVWHRDSLALRRACAMVHESSVGHIALQRGSLAVAVPNEGSVVIWDVTACTRYASAAKGQFVPALATTLRDEDRGLRAVGKMDRAAVVGLAWAGSRLVQLILGGPSRPSVLRMWDATPADDGSLAPAVVLSSQRSGRAYCLGAREGLAVVGGAAGGREPLLRWDLATGVGSPLLSEGCGCVHGVALAPTAGGCCGNLVASAGLPRSLRLWDLRTGRGASRLNVEVCLPAADGHLHCIICLLCPGLYDHGMALELQCGVLSCGATVGPPPLMIPSTRDAAGDLATRSYRRRHVLAHDRWKRLPCKHLRHGRPDLGPAADALSADNTAGRGGSSECSGDGWKRRRAACGQRRWRGAPLGAVWA